MDTEIAFDTSPGFPGPLYAQVAAFLRTRIAAAEWAGAEALPNEASLARDIGVSVGTVRKALQMLETERLIQRRQGRGTFVVEASDETDMQRFSRLMRGGRHLKFDAMSVETEIAGANATEAARLGLRQGDRVTRLTIVWHASDAVCAVEKITVSEARFPGLSELTSMTTQFLFPLYRERYQVVVGVVTEKISCTAADRALAKVLGVEEDSPLLTIDRTASAASVGPVEWSQKFLALNSAYYSTRMS